MEIEELYYNFSINNGSVTCSKLLTHIKLFLNKTID